MFCTKVNLNKPKETYEFIKNHFQYYTMNSWNGLKSIANNVKLYNLNLKYSTSDTYRALEDDEWNCVNDYIDEWNREHPEYRVYFNGRSDGYLVLYNKDNNKTVLDYYTENSSDYEDLKYMLKEFSWGTVAEYHKFELKPLAKVIKSFDKLCDDLVEAINELTAIYLNDYKEE